MKSNKVTQNNLVQQLIDIKRKIEGYRLDIATLNGRLSKTISTIEEEFKIKYDPKTIQDILNQMTDDLRRTQTKLETMVERYQNRFKQLEGRLE